MARIAPLSREELAEFEPLFAQVEKAMGFVPNSMLTMGRRPEILRGFAGLIGPVMLGGRVSPQLKQLISFVTSAASGCRYCQAHTSAVAHRTGASIEKVRAAFDYATSPLFDDAERAALALAQRAGEVPNAATDAHFDALRRHFDEEQIAEIVAVIALFGFLNRWNDSVATTLEIEPLEFAQAHLAPLGWSVGEHA